MNTIKKIGAACLAVLACISAFAQAPASAEPLPPQEVTAGAHLFLSAMLNGESEPFQVPGMPTPRNQIADLVTKSFPDVALRWELNGFKPTLDPEDLLCLSSPQGFSTEDHEDAWLYHDDRLFACTWGAQPFMLVLRVTYKEEGGLQTWLNTEVTELIGYQSE